MSGQMQPPYNGSSGAPRMSEGSDAEDSVPF